MNIFSIEFIIFCLISIIVILLFRKNFPIAVSIILVFNILFYSFWGLTNLIILFSLVLINFILSTNLQAKKPKLSLFFSILISVSVLIFFKYYKFVVNLLLLNINSNLIISNIPLLDILSPMGLSFYIFKMISYSVDIYRKDIKKVSFIEYFAYISFFPQILSGPIMSANQFYNSIRNLNFNYDTGNVTYKIISGIFKKYTVASFLFLVVNPVFTNPTAFSRIDLIIAAFAYSAMIYCDFSGYSDISIGISKLLGINVDNNFNYPYKALNNSDFWRRWHISLSEWMKNYIYIPLGGNKKGKSRQYFNILSTMLISGLWHGAGLTYLLWGILHGIASIFSNIFKNLQQKFINNKLLKIPTIIISYLTQNIFISVSWVVFNSSNLEILKQYIRSILSPAYNISQFISINVLLVIIIVYLVNLAGERIQKFAVNILNKSYIYQFVFIIVAMYLCIILGPTLVAPFIYFNF